MGLLNGAIIKYVDMDYIVLALPALATIRY